MLRPTLHFRYCNSIRKVLCRKSPQSFPSLMQSYSNKSSCKGGTEDKRKEVLMDIKCKSAIITGGTSGIGFATASELLCAQAAHVFLSGTDIEKGECAEEKLNQKFGEDKATFIPGDVRDDEHLKELFETCMDRFKHVDILFNNAGVLEDRYWKKAVDINMTAVLRCTLLGLKYMGKTECGRGGVIINCSSTCGLRALPTVPVHTATKYGVIGITLNLGDRFHCCETGVRVVAICPGVTDTTLINDLAPRQYKEEWGEDVENEISSLAKQPPEIVAKAIPHLVMLAPTASVWVVEDCKLYLAEIPDRKTYSKLIGSMK